MVSSVLEPGEDSGGGSCEWLETHCSLLSVLIEA